MSGKNIVLRLTTRDADKVMDALRRTGQAGTRMADTLERAGRRGSRGLRAVDRAASDMKGRLTSTASSLPIIGGAMASLGPAGLAAAAGIAASALALQRVVSISREAIRAFDDIAKRADTLSVSTDTLQALRLRSIEEDVGIERLQTGLNRLANSASMAAAGTGELYTNLSRTHPELVEAIVNADTMEERLRLVTDALANSADETERNQIAYSAFGRSGLDLARMLARAEGGIDGMIARARELGLVVDEHILRSAEEMENRLGVASAVIDANLRQAFIDLAPVLVSTAEGFADIARWIASVVDHWRDLEDRSTLTLTEQLREAREELPDLESELADLQEEISNVGRGPTSEAIRDNLSIQIASLERRIRDYRRVIDEVPDILEERSDNSPPPPGAGGGSGDAGGDNAITVRNELEREALQIRARLGDVTGLLEAREDRLEQHVREGTLTREQATAELERYRENLDGQNESTRAAAAITAQMQTPLERYQERVAELARLHEEGAISSEIWRRAVEAATEELERSDPALRRAAEIRDSLLSDEERMIALERELEELVAAGHISRGEAAEYLERYREQMEKARGETAMMRLEQEALDAVMRGQINTIEDLGRIALRIFAEIAIEAARAGDASQGLGAFIVDVLGGIGRGVGIGSSGDAGAGSAPSGLGSSLFSAASNVVSFPGVQSAAAGASAGVKLSVHNYAGVDVGVSERRSSSGGTELELMLNRTVAGGIETGQHDQAMSNRFGAVAQPRGR